MKIAKLVSLAVLALASACVVDESTSTPVFDACSGDAIGVKDLATGEYRFDDGAFYSAMMVRPAQLAEDVCASPGVGKKMDEMPTTSFAPSRCFQFADPSCRGCCDGHQCLESCSGW